MIKCPNCGATNTIALDTRNCELNRIRRRKRCRECGYRFITYEVILDDKCYRFGSKMVDLLFTRKAGEK